MGVDIQLYLPGDTRVRDVAEAMGLLAGLEVEDPKAEFRRVKGVEVKGIVDIPGCAEITLRAPKGKALISGELVHWVMFHYEHSTGERTLIPRSTPFWIAVAKGLVDFFGGRLVYQDCGSGRTNYRKSKPRRTNSPEDGAPWHKFNDALYSIKPLTMADLVKADKVAAYKLDGSR